MGVSCPVVGWPHGLGPDLPPEHRPKSVPAQALAEAGPEPGVWVISTEQPKGHHYHIVVVSPQGHKATHGGFDGANRAERAAHFAHVHLDHYRSHGVARIVTDLPAVRRVLQSGRCALCGTALRSEP